MEDQNAAIADAQCSVSIAYESLEQAMIVLAMGRCWEHVHRLESARSTLEAFLPDPPTPGEPVAAHEAAKAGADRTAACLGCMRTDGSHERGCYLSHHEDCPQSECIACEGHAEDGGCVGPKHKREPGEPCQCGAPNGKKRLDV